MQYNYSVKKNEKVEIFQLKKPKKYNMVKLKEDENPSDDCIQKILQFSKGLEIRKSVFIEAYWEWMKS